jgi:DNA-binding transcriptional LysR family regulator
MDRFDAMQAFVRVVEAGSFTKAAETLSMNKTTVTQLIQQLEARLRVKLLNRTTRQVNVTPDGAAYYERVLRILGDVDEAENSLSNAQASPRGRQRVDVPGVLGRLVLLPALPLFHARYPDIQIDMGVSDRPIDLIGDNVDCVVRGGEVTDQSLVARRIGEFSYLLCAAPSYLARLGAPAHPQALVDTEHRIVGHFSARTGKLNPYVLHRGGETLEVVGRYTVAVNDGDAILAAGLAGMGVIRMTHFVARPHLAGGTLVPVLADWSFDPLPVHIAFPPNRHVSAKLRVFVDWVAELMAEHAPMSNVRRRTVEPRQTE